MFSFSLSDVPQYCQHEANYCGSASAQMIMNGYPDHLKRKLIFQPDIYHWIESNQSEPQPYKAPEMVRDAIHQFNAPPSPAHFVTHISPDPQQATYQILLWMRRTNYPATAMINGNHWVVITGFETNLDPEGNQNIELLSIDINDPLPYCG